MIQTITIHDIRTTGEGTATAQPVAISAEALEGIPAGQIIAQQGDIYLAVLDRIPQDVWRDTNASGQLAPGTTQGSRHCVDPHRVWLWHLRIPTALQGPIIEAQDTCTITHPEHGHITLPPGIYQITYQRAYAAELRRITD